MNAIVTITIGKAYEQIARMTHASLRTYATKLGVDFVVLDKKQLGSVAPHYEKFQIYHLLNKYDRIIYIDTDVVVRDDCPSLFDLVPYHMIGLVNEGKYQDRSVQMRETCKTYDGDFASYDLKRYYNTGVMVVSRIHKELFVRPKNETVWNFYEQSYLNLRIQEMRLRVFDLDYKFNRVAIMDGIYGEHRLASYIVHYAGVLKGLDWLIPSDLGRWAAGEHNGMRRNVTIGVGARLGDNVCAEPVVRYMIENSTKTRFTIATMHPDIFAHLDANIINFDKAPRVCNPENPCVFFNTAMDEKDPRKEFLTSDYMHVVDYISLMCLKRQLSDADKRIRLGIDPMGQAEAMEICQDPSRLILVHPGKSWPSKTFPIKFWDEIISRMTEAGLSIGLIGRDVSKKVGVLDVGVPNGAYDFRNLLSLKGLIALISMAPVLVSNDSAPIHIAGAFDNHLVVIPTCKHPDLILPYRNGSKHYKCSICMGAPMWNTTRFDQSDLYNYNMVDVDDIMRYLPSPGEVATKAIEAYANAQK